MASLGCGIDSIIERIENIKSIIRKYTMVSNAIASWTPVQGVLLSINIPFADLFKEVGNSAIVTSLYDAVANAYNIAKTGIAYVRAVQAAVAEIQKDFGDIVSNLSGILQDIQDLTVLDIQVLELDLAKLGLNPGEIITRIKNGEDLDVVLGDAKEQLSESSKLLIDKLSKPLEVSFDTTCQKLPNIAMVTVGNLKTYVVLPERPQTAHPGIMKTQEIAPITTASNNDTVRRPADVEKVLKVKDSKYNFDYFAKNGMGVSNYNITRDWNKVSAVLAQKTGLSSTTLLKYIELNYNAIGYYIVKPLAEKYPKIRFTSGWRSTLAVDRRQNKDPNALSPHSKGCAFDFKFPDEYWKSYDDNPIAYILSLMKSINVGPSNAKIGKFQVIQESNPGDKYSDMVWHIGAVFAPIGNNSYNGNTVKMTKLPRV